MKTLNNTISVINALSDPTRIRIWMMVQDREVCVCHIINVIELAASTISEHLAHLKKVGLLSARKQGKWVYYKAIAPTDFATEFTQLLKKELISDSAIHLDQTKLKIKLGENPC